MQTLHVCREINAASYGPLEVLLPLNDSLAPRNDELDLLGVSDNTVIIRDLLWYVDVLASGGRRSSFVLDDLLAPKLSEDKPVLA